MKTFLLPTKMQPGVINNLLTFPGRVRSRFIANTDAEVRNGTWTVLEEQRKWKGGVDTGLQNPMSLDERGEEGGWRDIDGSDDGIAKHNFNRKVMLHKCAILRLRIVLYCVILEFPSERSALPGTYARRSYLTCTIVNSEAWFWSHTSLHGFTNYRTAEEDNIAKWLLSSARLGCR